MITIDDFGKPVLCTSDQIDAPSAPSPAVLGGRGRGEGGQAPLLEIHVSRGILTPLVPLPPSTEGEGTKSQQTSHATLRLRQEQAFHDRQACARAVHFRAHPDELLVSENDYLDHAPWIRPALEALGDVSGKRVLDFGCGHGMAAVVLARRGARVTAFDLSAGYLDEARKRAQANRVALQLVQANGECLPFANDTFDCVWGNAILHHLDLARAARELLRVLKPGGLAVFCEPWNGNPLLRWARRYLPYHGKSRTPDEAPLTPKDIKALRVFPHLDVKGYVFLSMACRVLGHGPFARALSRWDERLLDRFPFARRWCRYVVLRLGK